MDYIGPQLPKHLRKKIGASQEDSDDESTKSDDRCDVYGPKLPGFHTDRKPSNSEEDEAGRPIESSVVESTEQSSVYGPCLPPSMLKIKAGLSKSPDRPIEAHHKRTVLPTVPTSNNEDLDNSSSDDEIIGPNPGPYQNDTSESSAHHEIEERARAMKSKLTNKPESNAPLKREAWMTELPPELSCTIGVTARKFKTHTLSRTEEDRSVWTDTPADRDRKRKEKANEKAQDRKLEVSSVRDKEIEKQVTDYNQRKRPMSLLDMHKEKRKKEGSSSDQERKPFDRERDLAISRMDSKTKSNFIKKSKDLNTRFQEGKVERKFL